MTNDSFSLGIPKIIIEELYYKIENLIADFEFNLLFLGEEYNVIIAPAQEIQVEIVKTAENPKK